ncbi:MAG: rod shape-determining protein MreD [Oscillospiraceae bacterium]
MNIDIKRRKEKIRAVLRWTIYFLLLFIEYIIMTTMSSIHRMPLFIVATAICIAVFEDPFNSAILGCLAGLMLDAAEGTIVGLNGVILTMCCLMTSLLFYFIMRRHIVNVLALTAATAFIQTGLRYIFYYSIWGYDDRGAIYLHEIVPVMIFTVIASAVFYPLIRFLSSQLGVIKETYVEEKSENIVRE